MKIDLDLTPAEAELALALFDTAFEYVEDEAETAVLAKLRAALRKVAAHG